MAIPIGHEERVYLPALTGVRALAALLVLTVHANQHFTNWLSDHALVHHGYLGVDLFFILSGFIIAHIYLQEMVPPRVKPLCVFLWHRFIRLFPVHAVVLLAVVAIVPAGFARSSSWNYHDLPWQFLMVHAWGTTDVLSWNAPTWSISAEWFAYLLFPMIAAGVLALPRHTALPLAMATLLIAALLFHIGHWHIGSAWFGLPALVRVGSEFLCGVLIFRAIRVDAVAMPPWLSDVLAFGGLLSFCVAACFAVSDFLLIGLLAVLIAGVSGPGVGVRTVFGCRPAVWLGAISYSVYVVHYPVIVFLHHSAWRFAGQLMSVSGPLRLAMFFISLVAVIGVGALLFRLVEYPARRRLRNLFGLSDGKRA